MSPTVSVSTAALVLQIITAALQLSPLALETVAGIKSLLSKDPSIPEDLKAILEATAADNAATLKMIQDWRSAHPVDSGGPGGV